MCSIFNIFQRFSTLTLSSCCKVTVHLSADSLKRRFFAHDLLWTDGLRNHQIYQRLLFSPNVTLSQTFTMLEIKYLSPLIFDPLMLHISWIHRKPCFWTLETVKSWGILFSFQISLFPEYLWNSSRFSVQITPRPVDCTNHRRLSEHRSGPTEIKLFGFTLSEIVLSTDWYFSRPTNINL